MISVNVTVAAKMTQRSKAKLEMDGLQGEIDSQLKYIASTWNRVKDQRGAVVALRGKVDRYRNYLRSFPEWRSAGEAFIEVWLAGIEFLEERVGMREPRARYTSLPTRRRINTKAVAAGGGIAVLLWFLL